MDQEDIQEDILMLRGQIEVKLRDYGEGFISTQPRIASPEYMDRLSTYSHHKTINDEDPYSRYKTYLSDYPDKWIPDYQNLQHQFANSKSVGVEIYDPLQELSKEELFESIRNSGFRDFKLILLAHEITGGTNPSFIEIRTAGQLLRELDNFESDWSYTYWSSFICRRMTRFGSYDSSDMSTISRLLLNINPPKFLASFEVSVYVDSMDSFEDSVQALPHVIQMHRMCQSNPEDKIAIIEEYKDMTNLPLFSLWHIAYHLDELDMNNRVNRYNTNTSNYYLYHSALKMTIYYNYIVHTLRKLITSYEEAYPKGYFNRTKSARSVM